MSERYEGTHADGSKGIIVGATKPIHTGNVNVSQQDWDTIFGQRERKENYRSRTTYGAAKTEEEWWTEDGEKFYQRKVNGEIVELKRDPA